MASIPLNLDVFVYSATASDHISGGMVGNSRSQHRSSREYRRLVQQKIMIVANLFLPFACKITRHVHGEREREREREHLVNFSYLIEQRRSLSQCKFCSNRRTDALVHWK
jgi:hypothetical protein